MTQGCMEGFWKVLVGVEEKEEGARKRPSAASVGGGRREEDMFNSACSDEPPRTALAGIYHHIRLVKPSTTRIIAVEAIRRAGPKLWGMIAQSHPHIPRSLGMDHLIGTPTLKLYLNGYFVLLQLCNTTRVIANPYVYAEHREHLMRAKMSNRALAKKIPREDERARKCSEERRAARKARVEDGGEAIVVDCGNPAMAVDDNSEGREPSAEKLTLLNDPWFTVLLTDTEFQVDEGSREFALMNPL
ncbi:hypothetical protein B0H21DRAFT_825784 [Amylocystis lapponica]|nr:hypothetical protein B0H21DRAFT_825784 [Amylocystis lapponica]